MSYAIGTKSLLICVAVVGLAVAAHAATEITPKSQDESKQSKRESAEGRKVRPEKKEAAAKTPAKGSARRAPKKVVKIPAGATTVTQELRREFELGKLRKTSDYLKDSPNAELTADVIVAMLGRRLGTSESMDAYIKWQLLSGLPESLPEQLVDEAVPAYRNAPAIEPRPGMHPDQKKTLDRELRRANDPADLKASLVDETRRVDILNEPVIDYRDALLAKLPDRFDVMQMGLLDLYQRAEAGISSRKFADTVAKRITKWSSDAAPDEVGTMSGMIDELLAAKPPAYYEDVRLDANDNAYVWTSRSANINEGDKMKDLAIDLARKGGLERPREDDKRDKR